VHLNAIEVFWAKEKIPNSIDQTAVHRRMVQVTCIYRYDLEKGRRA
jgi:hypothetical protein